MKYQCSIVIERPRADLIPLFEDTDRMGEWQDGFISFDHMSGEPGSAGSKAQIMYQMGKRKIEMIETMESYNLPDEMVAIYEADKVWNRNVNRFIDLGDKTRWEADCEFQCGGFVKLLSIVMPGMFRKQTNKMMSDFKRFAEAQ